MATITPRKITDATSATAHWQERTATAGARWLEGYLNPRRDPKAAMIAAEKTWEVGVTAAVARKAFSKGASTIDLTEMADTAASVGVSAYQNGTQARVTKFARKISKVIAAESVLIDRVRAMPDATIADRAARAAFWITEMSKLRGTF